MATALDVARYLIHLASPCDDEDIDSLTHLRLQKLLYYVQGWHLGASHKPIFAGRIEAWTNGPVVREVYPQFAGLRYQAIPPERGEDSPALNAREKAFIRTVWDQYKKYSATALRDMTHSESPWLVTRGNLPPCEKSSEEITHQAMQAYFGPQVASRVPNGISLDQLIRAEEAIDAGKFVTQRDIEARLAGK